MIQPSKCVSIEDSELRGCRGSEIEGMRREKNKQNAGETKERYNDLALGQTDTERKGRKKENERERT